MNSHVVAQISAANGSAPLVPTWLSWVFLGVGAVFVATFVAWSLVTLLDEWFRGKARDRFFETLNVTFTRGLLTVEHAKILSRAHYLRLDDLRQVLLRLLKAACLGQIERKDADDIRELEALLKSVEEEDPFQAMPSELKGPLLRVASALPDKTIIEPLVAHLRDFSIASRKEKRKGYLIALAGVVLSAVSVVLAIWLK